MKSKKIIVFSLIGIFIISSVGSLLILLELNDPRFRSDNFWFKIVWIELNIFLIFLGSVNYFINAFNVERGNNLGAIAPTILIYIFAYSLLSLLILILNSYTFISDKTHNISQILSFTLLSILSGFSFISYGFFKENKASDKNRPSPNELANLIEKNEINLTSDNKYEDKILLIKEKLKFSLIDNSRLYFDEDYKKLVSDINLLCETHFKEVNDEDLSLLIKKISSNNVFISNK